MKIQIKKNLGNSAITFEIDEAKDIDALSKAGFLCEIPDKCTLCNSPDVRLSMNKAEGYTFIKVKCKCGATAQMGQYKDGGFFWKNFEMYQKKEE